MRSREQLRCTTEPWVACQGEASYSGWSTQTWDFGTGNRLPGIRDIPLLAPLISSFFGGDVAETGQFTACLLPREEMLFMPAEAQDVCSQRTWSGSLENPPPR